MTEPARPRRWDRWLLPGTGLLLALIGGSCLLSPFYVKYRAFTGITFFEQAVEELNDSRELTRLIGKPIETPSGWRFWQYRGTIDKGYDASFPVSGTSGTGTARLVARHVQDAWTIETLTVEVEGHGSVRIIPQPAAATPEPAP